MCWYLEVGPSGVMRFRGGCESGAQRVGSVCFRKRNRPELSLCCVGDTASGQQIPLTRVPLGKASCQVFPCTPLCPCRAGLAELLHLKETKLKQCDKFKLDLKLAYDYFNVFFKDFIYLFLEIVEGRKKERWRTINGLPLGPQPRHVPWRGIGPVTLWFTGQHSTYWATPARAISVYF